MEEARRDEPPPLAVRDERAVQGALLEDGSLRGMPPCPADLARKTPTFSPISVFVTIAPVPEPAALPVAPRGRLAARRSADPRTPGT